MPVFEGVLFFSDFHITTIATFDPRDLCNRNTRLRILRIEGELSGDVGRESISSIFNMPPTGSMMSDGIYIHWLEEMLIILVRLSLEEGEDLKEVLRVFASLLTMSSIFAQKWNSSNLICMTVLESGNVRPDPLVRIGGSFRCIPVRLCTFVNAGIKILSLPFSNIALSNTMSLVIGFGMIPMLLTLMIKD